MKGKLLLMTILLLAVALTSCEKKYTYVEVILEKGIFGGIDKKEKEPKIIKAKNDTLAYLDAYQKFCRSVKINKDMREAFGETYSTPFGFKLLNDKGENIANSTFFITREEEKRKIEERVSRLPNNIKKSAD